MNKSKEILLDNSPLDWSYLEAKEEESSSKRYTVNILFYNSSENIVAHCATRSEADSWEEVVDESVKKASVRDNASGKVEWIKK